MQPRLSLVIPAFNEAARLSQTLERAAPVVAQLTSEAEILVVDDGSTDETAAVARAIRGPVPICVLRQESNRGKGAAVARGVEAARYPLVGFTDADCPYDLSALEGVLDGLSAGRTDIAIGARDLPASQINRGYGFLRYVSGKTFSLLTWAAIGLPFRDSQCGLKVFRAEVARELFATRTIDHFGFDFEILAAAIANDHRVERFAVCLSHNDDSRIDLVADSLQMVADLWRVRRNLRRGAYAPLAGQAEKSPCPLCGGEEFTPRASAQGFRMVECCGCSLWYLNPMPTPGTLARLYKENYFESEKAHQVGYANYAGAADDFRATFRRRLQLVQAHIGSGRLLDVGAGFGYLADAARDDFAERWVVEMNDQAAARVAAEHRVVIGSFDSVDLPQGYFDVVSMQDCLEHMPDPRRTLGKIRTLLRPGGAFLAVTPNVDSWHARLQRGNWVSLKFPEHVVLFSGQTLRRVLEESGFEVVSVQSAGQYARLDFVLSRLLGTHSRLGERLARIARSVGGAGLRVYVPSGSIAVVATPV